MDNQFIGDIDDIGNFYILEVNSITKDKPSHNFTVNTISKKEVQQTCTVPKFIEPHNNKLVNVGLIKFDNKCLSPYSFETVSTKASKESARYDTFIPETFDISNRAAYDTRLDLVYNSTLIRNPTSSSPYSHDGLWKVILYLEGIDVAKVSKITYYLHSSVKPNNVITVTSENNPNFSLHLSLYGGFKVFAKVYLKNGEIIDLSRFLVLYYYRQ